LYFHDAKLSECKNFKDEFIATAEKLYGMVKVGAIDCREEEELCEEFQVFDIPQIKIFSADFSDDGDKYTGKQETNAIAT
jgi:thioredoxin-like negative regulator of GroEL